jgi:hypothetical protein
MLAASFMPADAGNDAKPQREDATMKTTPAVLLGTLLLCIAGCDDPSGGGITEPVTPTGQGTIDGEFTLPAGVQGTVANVRVAVYRSQEDLQNRAPAVVTTTDEQGRFFFSGICCGHYYIDAWKDVDANDLVSRGDYYLIYSDDCGCASMCQVSQGLPATFCGELTIVQ